MLYSRSLSVTYFIDSSVCVTIPVFQFIPSPFAPSNVKFVFYICNLFCSFKFICSLFLDSTYKWYYMIFVSLRFTSLSMTISRLPQMTLFCSFLFHCVYAPHLLCPRLCWWTFRLFPYPGYCK